MFEVLKTVQLVMGQIDACSCRITRNEFNQVSSVLLALIGVLDVSGGCTRQHNVPLQYARRSVSAQSVQSATTRGYRRPHSSISFHALL